MSRKRNRNLFEDMDGCLANPRQETAMVKFEDSLTEHKKHIILLAVPVGKMKE